jgi:predicted cation transporter
VQNSYYTESSILPGLVEKFFNCISTIINSDLLLTLQTNSGKKLMTLEPGILIGFLLIFLVVLLGPFKVKIIEENLEVFLFLCGVAAMTIAGSVELPGLETGWRMEIIEEALTSPLHIGNIFGIPIGIFQIVLIFGLIIYRWHEPIHNAIRKMTEKLSLKIMAFILIAVLGLVSSVISAILAAIILVEMVHALPLSRKSKVDLTVIACFSIGLGAALTPLGEPLSTIAVSKLSGEPYNAGFTFLFNMLGLYILPGILAYGLIGMFFLGKVDSNHPGMQTEDYNETLRDVIMRAIKVYVFIMALVLLGDGFKPIIFEYFAQIPPTILFWVNMVSAILDNATLAAAQIGPTLTEAQIKGILMGLLISGGMLIPGNIPNIISASKLGITSKEWARLGLPLGLVSMVVYFIILFVIQI